MSRRVTISGTGLRALEEARRWLCQPGSGADGWARWQALEDARHRLRDHPYLGKASAEQPGRRQLVVHGYRLVYRISPDTGDNTTAGNVRILQVFGPKQR